MPLFKAASDDSHNYHSFAPDKHYPGRGWVMVEAETPDSQAVVDAMARRLGPSRRSSSKLTGGPRVQVDREP